MVNPKTLFFLLYVAHKKKKKRDKHTRAMRSASTIGMPWALKRLDTVLFPDEIPPVRPTILILPLSANQRLCSFL